MFMAIQNIHSSLKLLLIWLENDFTMPWIERYDSIMEYFLTD